MEDKRQEELRQKLDDEMNAKKAVRAFCITLLLLIWLIALIHSLMVFNVCKWACLVISLLKPKVRVGIGGGWIRKTPFFCDSVSNSFAYEK